MRWASCGEYGAKPVRIVRVGERWIVTAWDTCVEIEERLFKLCSSKYCELPGLAKIAMDLSFVQEKIM